MGACPLCGEYIYECEWDMVENEMVHERCRDEWVKSKYHVSDKQFARLCRLPQLRQEIADLREEARALQQDIDRLEQAIKVIEQAGG